MASHCGLVAPDEGAADEAPHGVGHEVNRLAAEPVLDEVGKSVGGHIDVPAPVEGEGLDRPRRPQPEDGPGVGPLVQARGPDRHGGIRLGCPVVREPEALDPAGDQAQEIEPDRIFVAAGRGGEARAHDARQEDDISRRRSP